MTKHPNKLHKKSWRDYLVFGGLAFAAFAGLIIYIFLENGTPKVISIAADDISLSAKDAGFSSIWNEHCQVRTERYIGGDDLIYYLFADQPEKIDERTISTELDKLAVCHKFDPKNMEVEIDKQKTKLEIGKKDGTCLICLLKTIQSEIRRRRGQGDKRAVIVSITLQAAEPSTGQSSVNFDQVKKLVSDLTRDRGVVSIVGTQGQLHSQLERSGGNRLKICFVQNTTTCFNEAFDTARKL
jgi:hypothetical protein